MRTTTVNTSRPAARVCTFAAMASQIASSCTVSDGTGAGFGWRALGFRLRVTVPHSSAPASTIGGCDG